MNIKSISTVRILSVKEFFELSYWKIIKIFDKKLNNSHYKYFYTTYFSLPEVFYNNKIILDIGCGPRGSLEWADRAKKRMGLDPLADKYLNMGAKEHKMTYVKGYVENLPFHNNYFDIISSFNSLDHVGNIKAACDEIKRTLKDGGIFLLIVDIHNLPTLTEPQTIRWTFIKDYFSDFEIINEKHLERVIRNRIYSNLRINKKIENNNKLKGVLTVKLKKHCLTLAKSKREGSLK